MSEKRSAPLSSPPESAKVPNKKSCIGNVGEDLDSHLEVEFQTNPPSDTNMSNSALRVEIKINSQIQPSTSSSVETSSTALRALSSLGSTFDCDSSNQLILHTSTVNADAAADFVRYLLSQWGGSVAQMSPPPPWVPAWVRLCAEWRLTQLEAHYGRLCAVHLTKMTRADSVAPPSIRISGASGSYADAINGKYEQLDLFSEGSPVYSKLVAPDDEASLLAADREGPMCLAYYGGDWNLTAPKNVAKRDVDGNFTCTAFLQLVDSGADAVNETVSDESAAAGDMPMTDPVTMTAAGEWQVDQGEFGQGFEAQPALRLQYVCPCHASSVGVDGRIGGDDDGSGWKTHKEQLAQDVALFWDMTDCLCAFPSLAQAMKSAASSTAGETPPFTDASSLATCLADMRRRSPWGHRHSKEFAIFNSPDAKPVLDAWLSKQHLLDILL